MCETDAILSRLLDKYEKSKHLSAPGTSNRRVMLRVDRKELPKYHYEDASVRDAFNEAAARLVQQGLISAEWVKGRPVLSCVSLNLNCVPECYRLLGRMHPRERAAAVEDMLTQALGQCATEWISAWRDAVLAEAHTQYRVPPYCRRELSFFADLLTAFRTYDALQGEAVTMRAFSSKCYHDTKRFEHNVRDTFLRIALNYHTGLAAACAQGELGAREQLAYLGIYARPELYELSGACGIVTRSGVIEVAAATPYGLALPSTGVDAILSVDLRELRRIILIENKTNYDEYILTEQTGEELVLYHGGFLSPQKRKWLSKFADVLTPEIETFFWADIDLGGFQMFTHLQAILPGLRPMRMSGAEVTAYRSRGLARSEDYLSTLRTALEAGEYPLFRDAIERILEYGVTIEQEAFLSP
ncbi:MAG: DUF2220 domain-containing protein [Clostridiales bacterium]|nr:DUF2220 domain-containing protein [Clostridiales bacterium]